MNYYRLINYSSSPATMTIIPPTWYGSRVDRCFVDSDALQSLNNLVIGPVQSVETLRRAEIALRALLFHDKIYNIKPGVFINNQSDLFSKPFRYAKNLGSGDLFPGIKDVLSDAGLHNHLWCVEDLYTFASEQVEKEYLDAHYARRETQFIKNRNENIRYSFWVDTRLAEFEKVAVSIEDYYKHSFISSENLISTFLKPLPHTGLANYLSKPAFKKHQDKICRMNANIFFNTLDKSWKEHSEIIDYQLSIPVYPFLAIVLHRAHARSEIPNEIILMREEFQYARAQLWERLDDTQLRNTSASVTKRTLGDIERETKQIIPKAFSKGDNWLPINFKFLGRLISLINSGTPEDGMKDSIERVAATISGPFHMIDAANVTTNMLGEVEWSYLFNKHFSDAELKNMENWRWE